MSKEQNKTVEQVDEIVKATDADFAEVPVTDPFAYVGKLPSLSAKIRALIADPNLKPYTERDTFKRSAVQKYLQTHGYPNISYQHVRGVSLQPVKKS